MTSSSLTPLGFTRAYQTYRAENAAIPFPDSRLLAAARFWTRHVEFLSSDAYATFWREDLPPLLNTVEVRHFEELHPDELAEIATFVASLDSARIESKIAAAEFWKLGAKKWFYVGEANRALKCLVIADCGFRIADLELSNPQSEIRNPQSTVSALLDQLGADESNQKLHDWLVRFDADWRGIRESGHTNLATCVLVERDAAGNPIRGRLRTLEARVEPLARSHDSDEVVFGHQLRAADDPQVRGAYSALAAMRNTESNALQSAIRIPQSAFFRARFTFADSGREPYGGDSLGFACLVAAHGDWWSKDLHRERRLISSGTALTGALNPDSSAESVSESSLAKKVGRVFFSPLTSLVVPKSNRDAAEAEVARLHKQYPARRLRILTAERATDLITDGNIMIPERVCLGEYAVRAAAKYSRSVRVQVPLLIVLLYALACLISPPLWVFFDDWPAKIEVTTRSVKALNKSGYTIGAFDRFARPLVPLAYSPDRHQDEVVYFQIADVTGDKKPEIIICPFFEGMASGTPQGPIYVLGSQRFGGLDSLCTIPLYQVTGYPGDSAGTQGTIYPWYLTRLIAMGELDNPDATLAVVSVASYPGRGQLNVYDSQGRARGTFVNQGHFRWTSCSLVDIDSDGDKELCLGGCNNSLNAAIVGVFDPTRVDGVSPPWDSDDFVKSGMRKGSQDWYLGFPKTMVSQERKLQDHVQAITVDSVQGVAIRVHNPAGFSSEFQLSTSLSPISVHFDDGFVDTLRTLLDERELAEYSIHLLSQTAIWRDTVRIR